MRKVRCLTGEVFTDYRAYLRSQHWRNVKRRYYEKHAYECVKCGWNRALNLHHKHYRNIGREKLEDLEALCRRCHLMEHGLLPVRKKWSWKVKLVLFVGFVWMIFKMWFYK